MKGLCLACLLVLLAGAGRAAADPTLIYPWDAPAPDAIVPCVPCIFSVPGLDLLFGSGDASPAEELSPPAAPEPG